MGARVATAKSVPLPRVMYRQQQPAVRLRTCCRCPHGATGGSVDDFRCPHGATGGNVDDSLARQKRAQPAAQIRLPFDTPNPTPPHPTESTHSMLILLKGSYYKLRANVQTGRLLAGGKLYAWADCRNGLISSVHPSTDRVSHVGLQRRRVAGKHGIADSATGGIT